MHRSSIISLRSPFSLAALICLVAVTLGALSLVQSATAAQARSPFVSLNKSYIPAPNSAKRTGEHAKQDVMSVSLVLQPNNVNNLNAFLTALYTPGNPLYHHWLPTGAYNKLFAPSAAQVQQTTDFLGSAGLKVKQSPSPFIIRATGTTAQVEAAFHTTINDYRAADGKAFFQNDTNLQVPATLGNIVTGISGLSNTTNPHPAFIHPSSSTQAQAAGLRTPKYGAGPNGSGLVPSQIAGIYGANAVYKTGKRGQGKGTTLAVFELSGYTQTNPLTYERQYFGLNSYVPLVNINVDGGPITPACPTGDTCATAPDYSGDVEVDADIEMQIAVAPEASRILVYNAPNDFTGQTSVDEYLKIANDNQADSISSSWGLCEPDAGFGFAQAESVAFQQMAAQGQSIFSSSGDTGAYDCLRDTGSPNIDSLTVEDPASQPYVTGVGGTSFDAYDPGANLHPSYHSETVWNPLNTCRPAKYTNCNNFGAGGGGVSQFWAKPAYQTGAGVISDYSQTGTYCNQTSATQYCREVPDVSANADEYTPYAEYCTGDPTTNSQCLQPYYGWFGIGGTSLSSPLWSAVIGLWDSVHGQRFGEASYGLYQLFHKAGAYNTYFHDITGINQTETTNGLYPTTPNYDMATGIGSPRISNIAEAKF